MKFMLVKSSGFNKTLLINTKFKKNKVFCEMEESFQDFIQFLSIRNIRNFII